MQMTAKTQESILQPREGCHSVGTAQSRTKTRSTAQSKIPTMNYRRRGIQTRSNILKHPPARSTAQKITPKRLSAQLTTPTRSVNQTITPTKLTAQSSTPKTLTDQTTIPMGSTTQGNSLTKLGVQRTVRTRSTGQRTIPQRLSTQCDKLTMFTIENSLLTLSPTDKETKMVEQDETEANEVEYFQTTFGKRRTSLPAQVTIHPATRLAAVAEQKAQTISLRRSPFRMTANRMKLRQCHLKTPTPISQLREQTLLKQRPLNVDATSRRIDVDMLLQPCAQTANRSESQMDSTTINSRLIYPSLVMTPGHSYSPFVGSDTTVTQRPATKSSLYEVARESESGRALELNAITPEVKQRSACVHTPGNQPSLANISGSPASRSTRVKLKTHTPRYNQKCARAFNSPTRRDSKILRLGKKLAPRSQAMRLKTKFSPSPAPAVVPKNSKPGEPTRHFGTLISQNVETPEEAIGRLPSVASPRDILLTKQSLQIVNSVVLRSSKKLTPQTSKVQTPKADFLSSPAKSFTCSPKRSQRCHTPERLKTNSSVNVTPRSQKTPQSYACDVCHERLPDKKSMLRHQRCHQKGATQDGGGLSTPNKGTLVRTPKIISKPSTDFECDVCQKKFRFRSNLKAHQAIHDQQRIFECSLCQNSLIVTALHSCHLVAKVVGKPENKITDGCSDGHGHSRDTRTHAQTRIRRFMCDKCARTFASESNLKIHMKTHTIDKLRDILKATSSRFTAE